MKILVPATAVVVFLSGTTIAAGQQPPAQPPPATTAPAQPPTTPKPAAPRPKPAPASAATLTVDVTDKSGNPVAGAAVDLAGPIERSGVTDAQGSILFRGMRNGTYRLRFEHEGFTTLERELAVRAGQPTTLSASLNAAPAKPEPPPPPPAPEPVKPTRTPRVVEPRSLSLPDFLDKNLIGGQPQKITLLACAEGGTSRLVQVRDPLENQEHADEDELLYVVAGAGVIRIRNQDIKAGPGHFALVPRGVPHNIRREGRNPIILLSILTGTPCEDPAAAPTK